MRDKLRGFNREIEDGRYAIPLTFFLNLLWGRQNRKEGGRKFSQKSHLQGVQKFVANLTPHFSRALVDRSQNPSTW